MGSGGFLSMFNDTVAALNQEFASETELRAYFKNYADLLKECFQDVLNVGRR